MLPAFRMPLPALRMGMDQYPIAMIGGPPDAAAVPKLDGQAP